MQREKIQVEKRTITGKKVSQLRKEGLVPANIYGKDFTSTSIQLPLKDFKTLYKKVGETGLVDVTLDGKVIPILIQNVHIDPKSQDVLHADFFKVNLKEKITANIPVVITGEAVAVTEKKGTLLQLLQEIEVEALPTDLPEKIEVNVEKLAEVDEQILVSELSIPSSVTVITDGTQGVVRIGELAKEEPVEVAPAVEGETPAEGEAAPAEGEAAPAESAEKSAPASDK